MSRKWSVLFFLLGLPSVAWPQTPVGTEFQVNSYTPSYQYAPSVGMDADGNFVVVWESYGQDGDSYGIFGQRFAANGVSLGGEFQVNSYITNRQKNPSVAVESDGDFVVVWGSFPQDGSSSGVFGQRFAANGAPLGGEFQINSYTTIFQGNPSVVVDPDGDFVVVWESYGQDRSSSGVFGQRFGANGALLGGEFQVNSYTTSYQFRGSLGVDADGDFVVVWQSSGQDGSEGGIFGRRFAANGAPVGGEFQVNSYTTGGQGRPSVAVDSDGDFVVVWTSQDGIYEGVFGQRFAANGASVGGEFQINSYTTDYQGAASVGVDTDGDFVVVWESYGQDGSYGGIFGQRFTPVSGPLAIRSNRTVFSSLDILILSVDLDNPGAPLTVDFYLGVLLPDGDTIVFFTDLAFNFDVGSLGDAASLRPMVGGVDLSTPFSIHDPSFFSYSWTGGEPAGSYLAFLAAAVPGGFADGRVDPGDILGLSTVELDFIP